MPKPCSSPCLINNYDPLLSDNTPFDIEYRRVSAQSGPMKHLLVISFVLSLAATGAQAACYADYKAKKDGPLQLHYGVIELPQNACRSPGAASKVIAPRLAQAGWTLLNVMSVFDDSQLAGKKANAGQFFLRY